MTSIAWQSITPSNKVPSPIVVTYGITLATYCVITHLSWKHITSFLSDTAIVFLKSGVTMSTMESPIMGISTVCSPVTRGFPSQRNITEKSCNNVITPQCGLTKTLFHQHSNVTNWIECRDIFSIIVPQQLEHQQEQNVFSAIMNIQSGWPSESPEQMII